MQIAGHASRALRYVWASPYSLLGLLLALTAILLGATARVNAGTLKVAGGRFGLWLSRFPRPLRFSAVTIGHIILGESHAVLESVSAHEHVHVRQYERWGILFVPAYCCASLFQLVRGRSPHFANPFEKEAYATVRFTDAPGHSAHRKQSARPRRNAPNTERHPKT